MSREAPDSPRDMGVDLRVRLRSGTRVPLRVDRLAAGGRGVARHEGLTVFVAGGVPGDVGVVAVDRVHARYAEGHLVELSSPSPSRRVPPCPIQSECGGCPWMALDETLQREAKGTILSEALRRIGGFRDLPEIPCEASPSALAYRNKVEFTLGRDRSGRRVLGLHRHVDATTLVDVPRCLVLADVAHEVYARCREHFLDGPGLGDPGRDGPDAPRVVIRHSVTEGKGLVVLRGAGDDFPSAPTLARSLGDLVVGVVRVSAPPGRRGGARVETIAGRPWLEEEIGGIRFRIPAAGFFQVNSGAAAILHRRVLEAAGTPSRAVDLYGGVGLFGLALAKRGASAVIVEADAEAVACGIEAAERCGIPGARFVRADAVQGLAGVEPEPDVVVADPPRTGLGRGVAAAIASLSPRRIVLVGCDPASFARDTGALARLGYRLSGVSAIDLFPQTDHVEAVGILDRG